MNRGLASCAVALLVLTAMVVPAASASTPETAAGLPQEFDPDTVSLTAGLQANGDADWSFTYRMRLETDNETAAFESLQEDIRTNRTRYLDRFRQRVASTVGAAENATGREMAVSNVSVSTRVNSLNEDSLGVVTYSFEWAGFAATDGDRILAGDALEGFYLDSETSLTISWPNGYQLDSVDPQTEQPRDDAVLWTGPLEFGSGQPSVVVSQTDQSNTTTTAAPTDTDETGGDGVLFRMLVGGVVALLVLGGGAYLYWRREGDAGSAPARTTGGGDGESTGDAQATAAAGTGAAGGNAASEEPPEELLSNEERVKRFLESQGGRAKQQAVVDEMGWTEAKTSQVVKEMRENDELESFRIGRENVLKLPDADDIDE
jgi:hypothetical protein